jgi:SAM-dependent methyltransferase
VRGDHRTPQANPQQARSSAPDRDFGPVAKFYPARIAYAPAFFPMLAESFGLTKESFALDLACGTGELALGLAPHCGSVLGIDRSAEMLVMRGSLPANVRLMQAELNSGSLHIPGRADLVTIGRALHYLKREALLPLLASAAKPSASVVICNSTLHRATPWAEQYNKLMMSYVAKIKHPDFWGGGFFAGSGWAPVRRLRAAGTVRCSVQQLVFHALSFPRYAEVLLKHQTEFSERLSALLKPFQVAEDHVNVQILSEGLAYRRQKQ